MEFSTVVIESPQIMVLKPETKKLFFQNSPLGEKIPHLFFKAILSITVSVPLGISMLVVGSFSLPRNSDPRIETDTNLTAVSSMGENVDHEDCSLVHIPLWLTVSGGLLLIAPVIYFLYDKFCKPDGVNTSEAACCLPLPHVSCFSSEEYLPAGRHHLLADWPRLGTRRICLDIWGETN